MTLLPVYYLKVSRRFGFLAGRSTRKLFDVGVLYGEMLDNLDVNLTYESLGVLYSISNVPIFETNFAESDSMRDTCTAYLGKSGMPLRLSRGGLHDDRKLQESGKFDFIAEHLPR